MKNPERNQTEKKRILVADDHPVVRESLKLLIGQESDLAVCGEAENREQALTIPAASQPHLVILDLSLKDSHGTELIKDLHARYPQVLILVLSMHDESIYAERVIRAGAQGYITKQEPPSKILTAIRCVLSGEIYWSETAAIRVATKFARPSGASPRQTIDSLTDREMQVLERIGIGQGTRQIAATLHIDVSTVETYRSRIKEKLNLKNGVELLQFAIRWENDLTTDEKKPDRRNVADSTTLFKG
ncbi:MAG TPA: response regulator transcription factor [Phycisphaerae bacterium]|nr:response regulator transcription factor [Phycisphaerae bacterium]